MLLFHNREKYFNYNAYSIAKVLLTKLYLLLKKKKKEKPEFQRGLVYPYKKLPGIINATLRMNTMKYLRFSFFLKISLIETTVDNRLLSCLLLKSSANLNFI